MKQFDRPRDQTLQKTLQRISLTLKKGPKKKRGKFRPWEHGARNTRDEDGERPEINCLLDHDGEEIEDVPLADAFTSGRTPSFLKLGQALSEA